MAAKFRAPETVTSGRPDGRR
jgi:hypothetical protein